MTYTQGTMRDSRLFLALIASLSIGACQPQNDPNSAKGSFSGKTYPATINSIYFRAFKSEKELELWIQENPEDKFSLYNTYPVLRASGRLGPKRKQHDGQVPEGFYEVDRFNPESQFHLSLGLNYPNVSDSVRSDREKPGTDIFIHGSNVSIGCLAMGNPAIEEIYKIAEVAKKSGNPIRVDIFPFRMAEENLKTQPEKLKQHLNFWRQELLPGYTYFEENHIPMPYTVADDGAYKQIQN